MLAELRHRCLTKVKLFGPPQLAKIAATVRVGSMAVRPSTLIWMSRPSSFDR